MNLSRRKEEDRLKKNQGANKKRLSRKRKKKSVKRGSKMRGSNRNLQKKEKND